MLVGIDPSVHSRLMIACSCFASISAKTTLMAAQLLAEAFADNRDDFERVAQRLDRVGQFEPEGLALRGLEQLGLKPLLGR